MKRPIDGVTPPDEPRVEAAGQAPAVEDFDESPIVGEEGPIAFEAPLPANANVSDPSTTTDAPAQPANAHKIQRMRAAVREEIVATDAGETEASTEDEPEPGTLQASRSTEVVVALATVCLHDSHIPHSPQDDGSVPEQSVADEPVAEAGSASAGSDDQRPEPAASTADQDSAKRAPDESSPEDAIAPAAQPDKSPPETTETVEDPEKAPNSEAIIFFNRHTYQAGQLAAEKMRESACTVVALEAGDIANDQDRQALEAAYTHMVSEAGSDGSLPPNNHMAAWAAETTQYNTFRAGVIDTLRGSNVHIALLDINRDHPDFGIVEAMRDTTEVVSEGGYDFLPNDELRELITRHCEAIARAGELREAIMDEQIQALKQTFPRQRIAIGTGRGHELLQEKIRTHTRTEVIHVDEDGLDTKYPLPYFLQVSHQIQRGDAPSSQLMDRALLERNLLAPYATIQAMYPRQIQTPTVYVASLSETEVSQALEQLETIKRTAKDIIQVEYQFGDFVADNLRIDE